MARSCSRSALSAFTWPPENPAAGNLERAQPAEQVQAAVLVPLYLAPDAGEPHVVLTRRRADLRRHAGEISFPGGRRDPEDADLTETALREAEEEIGLPREQVTLLAWQPDLLLGLAQRRLGQVGVLGVA